MPQGLLCGALSFLHGTDFWSRAAKRRLRSPSHIHQLPAHPACGSEAGIDAERRGYLHRLALDIDDQGPLIGPPYVHVDRLFPDVGETKLREPLEKIILAGMSPRLAHPAVVIHAQVVNPSHDGVCIGDAFRVGSYEQLRALSEQAAGLIGSLAFVEAEERPEQAAREAREIRKLAAQAGELQGGVDLAWVLTDLAESLEGYAGGDPDSLGSLREASARNAQLRESYQQPSCRGGKQ